MSGFGPSFLTLNMQRFKYEDNELIPILQAGDLITVNDKLVEVIDWGPGCAGCYFVTGMMTVLWRVDVHFTKT